MCTDQGVWSSIADEVILASNLREWQRTRFCLVNLCSPHGLDQQALLPEIAGLFIQRGLAETVISCSVAEVETLLTTKLGALADSDSANKGKTQEHQQQPLIILAYGLDEIIATEEQFHLEEALCRWHASSAQLTLLFATNMPLIAWGPSELWPMTKNFQLGPLQPEQVYHLADRCEHNPAATWGATFGYLPALAVWLGTTKLAPEEVALRVFEATINGCSQQAKELVQFASLLPYFNVAVLRVVNDVANDDDTYVEYARSISELQGAGIVTWDMNAGWFRFTDGGLRRLLATKYLRDHPGRADVQRKRALRYFVDDTVHGAYLHFSFVSAIYQWAASSLASPEETTQLCIDWMHEAQPRWRNADWYAVQSAWQSGGGDWQVRNELESRLGQQGFERITDAIVKAEDPKPGAKS